ncbi:hypothetical protein EUTSA_v10012391mg, partial [Eutrema salsugineum]
EVLINTLTMHFIGNPTEELESKKIVLTNLRCPTLGDFKWYKDIFVTNIFQRNDCNQPFWKERFISGLPSFFAERVINKLKDYSGGQPIPWNTITYGQLFAFVKKQGLAICQEHKDKKRNDKFKFKTTMGSFLCYNCKRPGHKSTECKMKKKINEIFQDQPDIQEKLTKLLISESEISEETDSDYLINEIENSSDSSSESQELSDNLCNCKESPCFLKRVHVF